MSSTVCDDHPDWARRLEVLFQRYFDREMTEEECCELLELWDEHPDCETLLSHHYKTEHLLRFAAAIETDGFLPPAEIVCSRSFQELELDRLVQHEREAATIVRPQEIVPEKKKSQPAPTPYRKELMSPVRGPLLLVLLLGFLTFAVYLEFKPTAVHQTVPFHPTGRVRASVDVRWPEGAEMLKPGQSISTNRIRFDEGLLELELKNGVRLALEGPIDFKINSAMQTFCGRGRLSATVPKQGKGFTVSTPFNDVIDLGTEFYLNVEDEKVQTHTITGLVSLGKLPNNTTRDLPGGSAFSIDTQGDMKDFPADKLLFQKKETVRQLFQTVQRRELSAWEKRLSTYRNDPGLVMMFDFEGRGGKVVNRSGRVDICSDGILHGARRTEGRWDDKNAIAFQSKHDAIDIRLAGEFQSLTLFASVRIDTLDRFVHCLLAGNEGDRGGIFWQLGSDGILLLAVQDDVSVPAVKYPSTPMFSQKHFGAWYQLATVVDARRRTVEHYLDGKLVNAVTVTKPFPIRIGNAKIGNGIRNVRTPADRSFRGRIDEFLIFDRALTADEISAYFNPSTP